jgi:acetyltransferase-like isoleucine patch superfamily enzyme
MKVGKYTYGENNITTFWEGDPPHSASLNIGSFCSIADRVVIFCGGNHRSDWITTFPFGHAYQNVFNKFNGEGHPRTNGDVNIGNDVWIGSNVTIMSGVTIGDGSILSANSHVVKDVEPYSIVGGNPAKLIKKRFDDKTIERLLEIKWWELDDQTINQISPILCSGDIEKLFSFFNNKQT